MYKVRLHRRGGHVAEALRLAHPGPHSIILCHDTV